MMSYEEFLEEPISVSGSKTMSRKEYYEKYIPNGDPAELYFELTGIQITGTPRAPFYCKYCDKEYMDPCVEHLELNMK